MEHCDTFYLVSYDLHWHGTITLGNTDVVIVSIPTLWRLLFDVLRGFKNLTFFMLSNVWKELSNTPWRNAGDINESKIASIGIRISSYNLSKWLKDCKILGAPQNISNNN